jgi:hypothetical protein
LEHALEHTLAMSMATTQREILDHTLSAVCEITPAEVGVVLQPDGDRYLHGDRDLAEALAGAVAGSRCCLGRARRHDRRLQFDRPALGPHRRLAGALVVVAATTRTRSMPSRRGARAAGRHAHAGLDRLRELHLLAHRADSDR